MSYEKTWSAEEQKLIDWIDNASLSTLLYRWRFDRAGSPLFENDVGRYYSDVLFGFRRKDPDAWSAASKDVGWDG